MATLIWMEGHLDRFIRKKVKFATLIWMEVRGHENGNSVQSASLLTALVSAAVDVTSMGCLSLSLSVCVCSSTHLYINVAYNNNIKGKNAAYCRAVCGN